MRGDARSKTFYALTALFICLAKGQQSCAEANKKANIKANNKRSAVLRPLNHGITATEKCARQLIRVSFLKQHPQNPHAICSCTLLMLVEEEAPHRPLALAAAPAADLKEKERRRGGREG